MSATIASEKRIVWNNVEDIVVVHSCESGFGLGNANVTVETVVNRTCVLVVIFGGVIHSNELFLDKYSMRSLNCMDNERVDS